MNCFKCNNKMTQLFTSFVCDICNPPKGNFKPFKDENGSMLQPIGGNKIKPWPRNPRDISWKEDRCCMYLHTEEEVDVLFYPEDGLHAVFHHGKQIFRHTNWNEIVDYLEGYDGEMEPFSYCPIE